MRTAFASLAGALTLCLSLPAAAQPADPGAAPASSWKPSIKLFAEKPAAKPFVMEWRDRLPAEASAPAPTAAPKPSVVCGMTLIPADPTIDPKIRVAPEDRGVAFTMRTVEPTVCKPR